MPDTPQSDPRAIGEAYLGHLNAGRIDDLVALFGDDGVLVHPLGEFSTPEAIRSFYADNVLAFGPTMEATSWLVDGDTCVFEVIGRVEGADQVQLAIDRLTVDAGGRHIARLTIYYR